ncbi:hypothetical protein EBT31_14870 [bacterium]|nr:hypothetical protein [bacterium]
MTFPALIPSARVYIPGDVPQQQQVALSGVNSGYRQGNRRIGQTLGLSFNNISEADLDLIKAHYQSVDGTFGIFFLSAEIWNGYTTPPVPLLSDYAWRYGGAPSITDGSCDLWSIELELTTYAINTGDLIFNGGLAAAAPARDYILNGGGAAATPARDYVIASGAAT